MVEGTGVVLDEIDFLVNNRKSCGGERAGRMNCEDRGDSLKAFTCRVGGSAVVVLPSARVLNSVGGAFEESRHMGIYDTVSGDF